MNPRAVDHGFFPPQVRPQLFFAKFEFAVFYIDISRLAFTDFAVENIDRERVEGRLVDSALVRHPHSDRHLVSTGILVPVELDLGFERLAHRKDELRLILRKIQV